ncbi:putative 2-aminoethylphosphonate ABC transporter permease subunit [Paenibacillus chondroitinus]|uniref:2-aminoethylphosphonate ABC transporter permease subunit n=1 Tax=Paenibacillus chondroitinus TaxID=59842 RepID=A0ABU6DGW0_9BACL|nr:MULTISPECIES: putative 2-aminoethylphosphonate ABC transporter permease subunit [Paenibacillus]MCY9658723.1 putative 2-aminoethylphosphonate ABC transporter permease subunit [Paenibacillus anseongense]MEB4796052.1 putative 2-aminoethylphosphonate ABC transporter permease subunit [Paenibacillus chondroitinus]
MEKQSAAWTPSVRRNWGEILNLQNFLIVLLVITLSFTILVPLCLLFSKAFFNTNAEFIGLQNFIKYFTTPSLAQSLWNTVWVSLLSTSIAVTLAFLYAYGISRTAIRGKAYLHYVAMLPLFEPTMMHGIALTYLFGNQGILTSGFFGLLPSGIRIPIYGPVGIVISEVIYLFPQAFLIFITALSITDQRLYEAAETLGASKLRMFLTVTLPSVKYGLISAIFVCFTACFTDFGAPQAIGGKFNVLATDIYKQVIGQQNMSMGATVGILLTIPAIIAFVVDRMVERKQRSMLSSKSTPYRIAGGKVRDTIFQLFGVVISILILIPLITIACASLIKVWPYNLNFSFKHYDFSGVAGSGLDPFWTSLQVSFFTAIVGTIVTFLFAYLIEKSRHLNGLRQIGYFLSVLPLALPGMVIGLAYIFFFNNPNNPMNWIYGSMIILVLANITHFYGVPFITATTALKKLDKEFELVSESMRVPFYKTLLRVTVPMCLPAIIEIAMYLFVNSMVTVSAVVFLRSADLNLAAVALVSMEDAGDVAAAAAMAVLIVITNIIVRLLYTLLSKKVRKKTEAWQIRK